MTVPKTLLLAFLATLPILSAIPRFEVASATPDNWSEVVSFTNFTGITDYFTCTHVDWRIRWSYVPDPVNVTEAAFSVLTYPQGENTSYIDAIMKLGNSETSGSSYIHDMQGTFYCNIMVLYTESFVVTIEQDLDSIPEFQSFFALSLFMMATLLVFGVYKKKI